MVFFCYLVAIENQQVGIARQLIEAKCDVNCVDNDHHSTALHRIVRYC